MSYPGNVNHLFLYHAYALALGGWVKERGRVTPLEGIAPSVLSITGGFGSASARQVNIGVRGQYPFGENGPGNFYVYVGHAYTEVRGVESDEDDAFGEYKTTVRSILNDVRINDVFSVEHAETVLSSRHKKPQGDTPAPEAEIFVGDSNISGLRVAGSRVTLARRDAIDKVAAFDGLQSQVHTYMNDMPGGVTRDPWLDELCDWNDPSALPEGGYERDLAEMNRKADKHLRYSLFKSAEVPTTPGVRAFKSSVEVADFGRIYFGEIFASHGTKQVTMFRIDLGCDNCGGIGGSGGSTNGSTYPP